jgi:hypothetical protein
VFLFDALNDDKSDGQFDLLDYGRGHKMRRRGRRVPDLLAALKSADQVARPARVEGTLSSRDVVEQLDAARIDLRYRSPRYLREPLAEFLRARPRGLYWLQAPAHVGKTTFVQGLSGLDPQPLNPRDDNAAAAVAAFFCKREYREGAATFLNGLERAIEKALDIREDANAKKPVAGAVLDAPDRAVAFVAWIDEWRDFSCRQHGLAERPRLLVAVDGIDETDPPERVNSLLRLLPRPEQLTPGLYLLLTSRRSQDPDCPRWLGGALAALVGTGGDSVTRIIGLADAGYLSLLRLYAADRLGRPADKSFDALFSNILEKAEARFVYVGFVVDRLLRGALPFDRIDRIAVGDALYRDFLDGLDLEFHPKLADAIRDLLLVLAAEEEAHDWVLGKGALIDRSTGAILKPVPEQWPGLPLELLARHSALDLPRGAGGFGYDGRFVEILLSLQGVLAISRGEAGAPRYRLGLKGLAEQIVAHPVLGLQLPPIHARRATLTLDAIDTFLADDAGSEQKAAASEEFAEGAAHVVPHIRLSLSDVVAARWNVSHAVMPASDAAERLVSGGGYRDAISWYDLWIWWHVELLRGRDEAGLGGAEDTAVENDLAAGYMNRGNAKQSVPGHGALAAIADYDVAIVIRERLCRALGEDCPVPWRNDLGAAYLNRGNAKQSALGHGTLAAIADYDVAIAIRERLREALGEDWPMPWRNDLARAYMNRGNAEQSAPGHGAPAAIADYDTAIAIMERLREALGADWPAPWRNGLAQAYGNRGNAKQSAPGHGASAAIADYDAAIAIMERLREALGKDWPVPWRNDLARAYMNRGNAKQSAPGHGAQAAIADYDTAIAIMERLREVLGEDWPVPWRNDLGAAYVNRGNAKQNAPGRGAPAAIADYDAAIGIMERLRETLGEDWSAPWRNDLATAYMNRGNAKQFAPGHGAPAAIADYDAAIAIRERLREALGEDWPVPWRNDLAKAYGNRGNAKRDAPGHGVLSAIADYDEAITLMERLCEALGEDWPVPWRNDLAKTYGNRGNAKQDAPGHGVPSAIADYDEAITLMERLCEALDEDWPEPWRNELAAAYMNRGNAKQSAPGHGASAAIADYDTAIAIRERLREALAEDWPVPWRNDLANGYINRGNAKQFAPRHGAPAAIADYNTAIAIMERLREALGEDWPVPWRNDLANAYINRGNAKRDAPRHGAPAAIADYDTAIAIMEPLREALGEDWPAPWRNQLAAAYMNRGNTKQDAPEHGALAAVTDHNLAIEIREQLRDALGADWPVPWRDDLAGAYMNRGNAKQFAPGHGALAAIADYDEAIAIRERLREALGADWPVPWRNDLAAAYVNRGNVRQSAAGDGAPAAIADYDAAIAIREQLSEDLGEEWPAPWRNDLATAYINRGNAKQFAPGHGAPAAIADYDAAIAIGERLREALGEDWPVPWRNDLAHAHFNRGFACFRRDDRSGACDDARRAEHLWLELAGVAGEGSWSSLASRAKELRILVCTEGTK